MRSPPFCLSARALIGQSEPYSPFVRGRVRQLTFEGSAYKIRHRQKDDVAMARPAAFRLRVVGEKVGTTS